MRNEWIRPALWLVGFGGAERHDRYAEERCEMTADRTLVLPSLVSDCQLTLAVVTQNKRGGKG